MLRTDDVDRVLEPLATLPETFGAAPPAHRQPIHTVYGGAHLFRADTAVRLGRKALAALDTFAPDAPTFARAIGLRGHERLPSDPAAVGATDAAYAEDPDQLAARDVAAWLAWTVTDRVRAKLAREPVEDFRLDFEDGYGHRGDEEEDACAARAALEVARGFEAGTLPPFLGIRIKSLSGPVARRAARTLDRFFGTLLDATGGRLPDRFVVTLPKVVSTVQVEALVALLRQIEQEGGLDEGALRIELMVETPRSLIGADGRLALLDLVDAAAGRCVGAHFGVYDYTASLAVTAAHQHMRHAVCDRARGLMQIALADTDVALSDGATNVMPVPVHRAAPGTTLTAARQAANRERVHAGWQMHAADVRHSLEQAFYQGWDLHPAQLPSRYGAVYGFFLEGLDAAAARLRSFVEQAAQATLLGEVFDDAATGQGLLNVFLRGLACGALTDREVMRAGLSRQELATRSFLAILDARRAATREP